MKGREEKDITVTELFRGMNLLLLDKHKEQLNGIKESLSMQANLEMDNSGVLRAAIEFFSENPQELAKLVPYVHKNKGYRLLSEFQEMLGQGCSATEIYEKLGVGVKITTDIEMKLKASQEGAKEEA